MMAEIKAIVRRDRVSHIVTALHQRADLPGVTISLVEGIGRRHGDATPEFGTVEMAKIETVVAADLVDWVIDTVSRAAFTGRSGDGKIFVSDISRAIDIRSAHKGPEAL
jgi:nitrogen regulatory protein PII